MKQLIREAHHSDHALEIIFSALRWVFLLLAMGVFALQYAHHPNEQKLYMFMALVFFGFIYMGLAEYYLRKSAEGSFVYRLMTRGGPTFDFIAYAALIPLTGGIGSPLIPLAYLIILHITVYWQFKGGFLSAILFIGLYSFIYFIQVQDPMHVERFIWYISNVFFLLLIGGLGGLIVSRERKHYSDKNVLAETARRDFLTGLYNHGAFQEQLRSWIHKERSFLLVLGDIDKFKEVNDQYGHVNGDVVLRQMGRLFQEQIPLNDGLAFRYGGEEFALLLRGDKGDAQIHVMMEQLQRQIRLQSFDFDEGAFGITMSFGCAFYHGEEPDVFVDKVDQLLYEAKANGRDCIVNE